MVALVTLTDSVQVRILVKQLTFNYEDMDEENLLPPEELENECAFCGEPCENEYCSSYCKRGYEAEN